MDELINKYTQEITAQFKGNLEALILVGSYSRGEEIQGLSDIEFWAVVNDLSNAQKLDSDANVSLGYTTRGHLKKLKPYIYTIEVKKFGKVLFGDKDILNLIPDYSYEDIDPIDGFTLLNNRIVEQLILLNKIEDDQKINMYEFDKGYIQLVNSLLVLNRRYRSLYPEKLEEFRKNDRHEGLLNKAEEAFSSINQQLRGIASPSARNDVNREEALKKWQEVRGYFKMIWLDEKKMLGNLKCWIKILSSGKPMRFFVYQKASKLYFSDAYLNRKNRDEVIENWERFVK